MNTTTTATIDNGTTENGTTENTAAESSTSTRTHRMLAALGSIAALAGAGGAWAGIAGGAPASPSVTMRITNHSAVTAVLVSADPNGGWWVQAPQPILRPGQTQTVIAATHAREQFVQIDYIAKNTRQSQITYALHSSDRGTDQGSTGVSNQDFIIRTAIQRQYPDAAAQFDLA
ncbi:hypothetical protein [Jongsikchunia kroppenstedtii]|uniref:hypothetical protein n=1 Tax=Jongsikchunia kroppenstedtii TaxID=1121721 RepID=UPI00036D7B53|nr:hypothetical protein [Jongsikchunia kroppenstedtii]